MRYKKKSFTAFIGLVAAAAVLLSGCAAGESAEEETAGTGSVTIVVPNEPTSFNPVRGPASDAKVRNALFEPLVKADPVTGELTDQGLLTSWESTAPNVWIFDVREGVTFQNGEPWDAAAAAFSININQTDEKANLATFFPYIDGEATVTDDGKVEVHTTTYGAELAPGLTLVMGIPPKYYEEVGPDAFNTAPIGTGPFVYESYTPGTEFVATAYKDYWKGAPASGTITFLWSGDPTARANLVASGEADVATDLSPSVVAQYESVDSVIIDSAPSNSRVQFLPIAKRAPFDNADLRKAAQLAINRDEIVEAFFGDAEGSRVTQVMFADMGISEVDVPEIEYDPKEAARLVKESGVDATFTMSYPVDRTPNDARVAEAIAADLTKAGFTVNLNPLQFPNFIELTNNKDSDAQAVIYPANATSPNPQAVISQFVITGSRLAGCTSPEVDALNVEAGNEPDKAKRDALYQKLETVWTIDQACALPLYSYASLFMTGPDVEGFQMQYSTWATYNTVAVK
jgi:peptide/nickel transport system substrate-binding protein